MNNESLVVDLVEWVARAPRSYADVMAAWRTSCPRLTIWEDSLDEGLVRVEGRSVCATARGVEFLEVHGRALTD